MKLRTWVDLCKDNNNRNRNNIKSTFFPIINYEDQPYVVIVCTCTDILCVPMVMPHTCTTLACTHLRKVRVVWRNQEPLLHCYHIYVASTTRVRTRWQGLFVVIKKTFSIFLVLEISFIDRTNQYNTSRVNSTTASP